MQIIFANPKIILPLPPVNQNYQFKMKKIITFVAVSAMVSLASCGGGVDEAAAKADSTRKADSVAAVEAAAKAKADSARGADSVAGLELQRKADSAKQADSIAAAAPKGGGKPKTPKAPAGPEQPKVKPGGRPGANK